MNNSKRLHPVALLIFITKNIKELLFPLLFSFGFSLFNQSTWLLTGSLIGCGYIFLHCFMTWYRQRYEVVEDEFRMETGAWTKKKVYIPLERIQSVDDTEGIWHRLFGVIQLQIETASQQGEPEAVLAALSKKEALDLKRLLLQQHPTSQEGKDTVEAPVKNNPELHITNQRLLIAGLTSGKAGAILAAVLGPVFSLLENFAGKKSMFSFLERAYTTVSASFSPVSIILFALLLAWLLSVGFTIMLDARFTLRRENKHLHIHRGLLERRRTSLPVRRIQAVHLVEGVLRQPFGYVTVLVESAGYGGEDEDSRRIVCFPLLKRSEVKEFMEKFLPEYQQAVISSLQPLPRRVRKRMTLYTLPLTAVVVGVIWYFSSFWGAISLLLLPLDFLYGLWRFQSSGWLFTDQFVALRSRLIARRTVFILRRSMQSRTLSQNVLTRRAGLAVFKTNLASGNEYESELLEQEDVLAMIRSMDPEREKPK
ncbi:PH domain-containing protein [Kroppenstedtia pulmonis]|uniref:PH domain-containing protein n=1 Tax=Kroppenstedtia pulmonis TaxID=1380685 RepID=A0A7D4B1X3_9BACL|nr:PH domain-containing protein [Kroppenstedtia pulmonis]QKG83946.1 PH domain-containing protein [Kroppenstedtia pulmonis]